MHIPDEKRRKLDPRLKNVSLLVMHKIEKTTNAIIPQPKRLGLAGMLSLMSWDPSMPKHRSLFFMMGLQISRMTQIIHKVLLWQGLHLVMHPVSVLGQVG